MDSLISKYAQVQDEYPAMNHQGGSGQYMTWTLSKIKYAACLLRCTSIEINQLDFADM